MLTGKLYRPWLAAVVCLTLAGLLSCGGGGSGVATLDTGRQEAVAGVTRSTGLLIHESDIATLPDWQRAKLNDSGWSQPYIAPLESDAVFEPSGELLLEFTRQLRDREGVVAPRVTGTRGASWLAYDPPPTDVVQGEYESVGPAETPPFGCNSDPGNEHNGHALEDVIVQETLEYPDAATYVLNGLTQSNWFNRAGGTGNDAQSAVYQVFAQTTGLEPGEPTRFSELSYRADLAPGVGPGGSCGIARAWLTSGLIWKRFNASTSALPNLDERYTFDILIAPSGAEAAGLTSSGYSVGRYQEFYCGDLSTCFGGGWIVGVESSSSGCEAFDTQVAAAYAAGSPFHFSPVYGVLLKRWQQQQLLDMDGPWEGEFGWPVLGPVPFDNGALQMSLQGSYYIWGMWFERGYMAWLDYDQEAYPETPDQVQIYSFSGSNVYCPATGHYQRIKPDYRYGGTAPWPALIGQPRVAVTVDGYRTEIGTDWRPPEQTSTGEYRIGLGNAGLDTVELSLTAQAWGGTPGPGCTYDYYIWAFRDGTIYMGNEAQARNVTHTYGSETRNLESTYVVRVQVSDSTGAVAYGDSYPINIGHCGGAASWWTGGTLVIREDNGIYPLSYNALVQDLDSLGVSYSSVDYSSTIAEDVRDCDPNVVIWYRGGPANHDENSAMPREWTDTQIDILLQILEDGYPVLLVSQDHGYNNQAFIGTGWGDWYGWDENLLPQSIPEGEERFLWALGLTEAFGVSGTGQFGSLKISPRNLPTSGEIRSLMVGDGFELYQLGAEYYPALIAQSESAGDVPLKISFGEPRRMVGYGFAAGVTRCKVAPGFVPGVVIDLPFEGQYNLAYVSGGCKYSPYSSVGYWPEAYNFENHGEGKVYWIGYPWANTEVTQSKTGEMVGPENRHMLLNNILSWLDPDYYMITGGPNHNYDGPPEIIQVNIGTWHDGAYDFGDASLTWDGATGDYPDQTMANPYLSSDPFVGDYIITTSRNNDWKNGNDIDFSFPWYAYIVDVNGDGVQIGQGNNVDDTVFFDGLLLEDPGEAWARDIHLQSYGQKLYNPEYKVPSCMMDGFVPPVVVAGYYVSTTGDVGGEVRAGYGSAPASTTINNADMVTAECIAHWPQSIRYGGVFLPSGYLQSSDPHLIWSMYPGQNMHVPEEFNWEHVSRIEAMRQGWNSFRWLFDVDPTIGISNREGSSIWNNPVFQVTDRISAGRVVTCDYGAIRNWNPDINRDGDDNSAGVNDVADKFPIRVRLLTEYSDYVLWDGTWPDHLPDPGIDPAEGGPIWYDDENDPPQFFADWPDYIEGGAYVVDTGYPVYSVHLLPYGTPPNLEVSGVAGNYSVTFNMLVAFGSPDYSIEFNIGYETLTGDPLKSFGMAGLVYGPYTSSFNGPLSHKVSGIEAPGSLPENVDLRVAARVTDMSNPVETDVYIWREPVRFSPAS